MTEAKTNEYKNLLTEIIKQHSAEILSKLVNQYLNLSGQTVKTTLESLRKKYPHLALIHLTNPD